MIYFFVFVVYIINAKTFLKRTSVIFRLFMNLPRTFYKSIYKVTDTSSYSSSHYSFQNGALYLQIME